MIYDKLFKKEAKLAVVGLGYVGLPLALEFAKKISVIGFDINEERLAKMRKGIDPSQELDESALSSNTVIRADGLYLKISCILTARSATKIMELIKFFFRTVCAIAIQF